ncbi:c-type cytochrome [Massilia endophytica]|uniref:c-type cytochrome n=1 Tax=Massilia endophytica TaxID=2899220 RepID=UPI001E47ADF4|nr:c-type cytochrome [Massilia endophytica]UGQ48674.1 c-type cytochrome [Massilia endophytica]
MRDSSGHRWFWRGAAMAVLGLVVLTACERGGREHVKVQGGDAERGRKLLAQYQCGSCHAIPGVMGARSTAGPSLETFARQSYIAGHLPNYPEPLVRWIVDPPAIHPGTLMPNMGVSPADARHMAAYLYTLQ